MPNFGRAADHIWLLAYAVLEIFKRRCRGHLPSSTRTHNDWFGNDNGHALFMLGQNGGTFGYGSPSSEGYALRSSRCGRLSAAPHRGIGVNQIRSSSLPVSGPV